VSKRDGRLIGHAKDPVTAGLALEEFLAPDHFGATGGELLCLGAGGSGTAIVWYLAHRSDSPRRIVCADTNPERLVALSALLDSVETRVVSGVADSLVAEMAPGSLVVNATGLGKDLPGSPVSGDVVFPSGGVVWEVNYRGSLEFLRTAQGRPGLTVVDGWRYFVHGWAVVVAEVFGLELGSGVVEELSAAALRVR
jgi:shikimate dehydrogenase